MSLRTDGKSGSVLRIWKAAAGPKGTAEYLSHFQEEVLPRLKATPGLEGAAVATAEGGDLLVLTLWESYESIPGFAGEEPDVAVVLPRAKEVLDRFDESVRHYEVRLFDTTA